jgi:hypothetical protein
MSFELAVVASILYRRPPSAKRNRVVSHFRKIAVAALTVLTGTAVVGIAAGMAVISTRGFRGGPRAVLTGNVVCDVGVIDKPEEFKHEFVIRNDGEAPLELARGPSSCSCTLTGLPDAPISPGGQAAIRVAINDGHKNDELKPGPLDRRIIVLTNDPAHPKIELGVTATVRRRIAAEPSRLAFFIHAADADAEKPRSAVTTIYSQTWERFELLAGKCSIDGARCIVEPAPQETLQSLGAKCGFRVKATLPPAMPDGRIVGDFEFDVRPDGAERQSFHLDVQGAVDGHLSFFGRTVATLPDGSTALFLRSLTAGEATHESIVLKINTEPKTLAIERIDTEPTFLHARIAAVGDGSGHRGVYRLEIEIPRDSPYCSFLDKEHAGVIRIVTDHPRFPTIELKVLFAVVAGN